MENDTQNETQSDTPNEEPSPTLEKIKREISALFDENDQLKTQVRNLQLANSALIKAIEALAQATQTPR